MKLNGKQPQAHFFVASPHFFFIKCHCCSLRLSAHTYIRIYDRYCRIWRESNNNTYIHKLFAVIYSSPLKAYIAYQVLITSAHTINNTNICLFTWTSAHTRKEVRMYDACTFVYIHTISCFCVLHLIHQQLMYLCICAWELFFLRLISFWFTYFISTHTYAYV